MGQYCEAYFGQVDRGKAKKNLLFTVTGLTHSKRCNCKLFSTFLKKYLINENKNNKKLVIGSQKYKVCRDNQQFYLSFSFIDTKCMLVKHNVGKKFALEFKKKKKKKKKIQAYQHIFFSWNFTVIQLFFFRLTIFTSPTFYFQLFINIGHLVLILSI